MKIFIQYLGVSLALLILSAPGNIAAAQSGKTILSDGTIVYEDGTFKTPGGKITKRSAVGKTTLPDGTILYPNGTMKKSERNNTTYKKVRHLPDGTIIYPDGTVKRPDGTVKYPDGRVKKLNGSVHYPDGKVRYPHDNSQAERWMPPGHAKKVYGEKSAKAFAPGQQKTKYKKYKEK